ncbi:hypothetical protein OIU34_21935 [Pararhizobium sp. BT-229]|uniref:hypothetical protein n=1 Tax=Pararhizobium sp. BT-229 TaxID=2986923 RepID=UPI0021F6E93E|nr:hypothetical protein [Pararhizobium sp. BT-229]MCV9964554.1 hypothetical protein [Pararhizobium sp. BT-229]
MEFSDLEDTIEFFKGGLHPDLKPFLFGNMVLHPLVTTPMANVHFCGHINRQYEGKLKYLEIVRAERNWEDFVFTHERPYRAKALDELIEDGSLPLDDKASWQLVSNVWTDSENVEDFTEFWEALWSHPNSRLAMSEKEAKAFAALPDPVPVWHGLERADEALIGISWTTSRTVGAWFARRFSLIHGRSAYLAKGSVPKDKVRAYLLARKEFEVIVLQDDMGPFSISELKPR